ncbi:hypothetical protein CQT90_20540 [Salmonella enterica]|nr:hypothetical protein [Salmonella enterica]ECX8200783.1 hypothetical protein [Salmonella enterica]ELE6317848.1 hypothetical protein [Salmonella enterica]
MSSLKAHRNVEYHAYKSEKITPYVLFLCAKKHNLSRKEIEVIAIIASGSKLKAFFKTDNRSIKTIYSQKRAAYIKIGVNNDVEFLHYIYWLSDKALSKYTDNF